MHRSERGRPALDYTDPAYWNGTIKMSLSKFFILSVLYRQSMHGYEIARAVERMTNGCCAPTEGTLYPALREFERGGYVSGRDEFTGGRKRRIYTLTEKGREAFRVAVDTWMDVTHCIRESGRLADRTQGDDR
jgi:DNA-binding PadR family transcriptional regulator